MNIYRPPQGDYKQGCKLVTEAFLKANLNDKTEIYLLGDFNIDFYDRRSPAFKELEFVTKSLNLTQLVPSPTRFFFRNDVMSHSKLDLIFSNSDCIKKAQVVDWNISDHQAVMITRKKVRIKTPKVTFRGRSYKNYVKEDFQEELVEENWEEFYNSQDPNKMWEIMLGKILGKADAVCPRRTYKVKGYK